MNANTGGYGMKPLQKYYHLWIETFIFYIKRFKGANRTVINLTNKVMLQTISNKTELNRCYDKMLTLTATE